MPAVGTFMSPMHVTLHFQAQITRTESELVIFLITTTATGNSVDLLGNAFRKNTQPSTTMEAKKKERVREIEFAMDTRISNGRAATDIFSSYVNTALVSA
ncbi:hypothetical protein JTB14_017152 [Gonioctena quinquepunctata]|nr:hypothetical protein JTB14_017152 [Gonioctena quinquepunctata]